MMKMTVRRVGIKAVAVWATLAFFLLGIFAGVLNTGWFLYSGQIGGTFFIWYLVITPVLYAGVGMITALIICVLYNSLNSAFGSIGLELVAPTSVELPPPPPSQWNFPASNKDAG